MNKATTFVLTATLIGTLSSGFPSNRPNTVSLPPTDRSTTVIKQISASEAKQWKKELGKFNIKTIGNCFLIQIPGTNKPNDKPNSNKPETDKPNSNKPNDKPNSNKPETDKPNSNKPNDKPNSNKPETDKPNSNKPNDKPNSNKPETDKPNSNKPNDKPNSNKPETDKPNSNKPNDKPNSNKPETDKPNSNKPETDKPNQENSFTVQVVNLVNEERAKQGLPALKIQTAVTAAAQIRSKEIQTSFSHTRPDGRSFSTALTENGVIFSSSGENIAWGQQTPEAVMKAWMNSPSHKANILNKNFTSIGVGYSVTSNGTPYWTQLFIK